MHTRPVWVEISRRKLIANYLALRGLAAARDSAGHAPELLAVVKANAYGHGMRDCARVLTEAGARWLGVTSVEEGIDARTVAPDADVLVLSGLWFGEAEAVVEHRLTPIIWESLHLDLLEAEGQRRSMPPRSIAVHLELDTGMSRQGVSLEGAALAEILKRFGSRSVLRLEGVSTHFSAPEVLTGDDAGETGRQCARFEDALEHIARSGLRPQWIHAGSSATLLEGAHLPLLQRIAERVSARLMLRPGLSLYGYAPRFVGANQAGGALATGLNRPVELEPVLEWKTRVTSLRTIRSGQSAGYNSTFHATRSTRLALLPVGYADGFNRLLSNRGNVLVRGRRAKVAGRISMDQTILDVTDLPEVWIGDEVALIGRQDGEHAGNEGIDAYELADLTGTIPYEVLCAISARVPRVLVD